jgi:hypothetical protein
MEPDRRRCDRLTLTIPLLVRDLDGQGREFKDDASTLTLNRKGARIRLARRLRPGQTITIINKITNREAEFRVVGPITPYSEAGGEWGVEQLTEGDDIWGIKFPPAPTAKEADSAALLECRRCHTVAMIRLSLVEVEVLQTSGLLSLKCEHCKTATPWGYVEKQVAMNTPPNEATMMTQAAAAAASAGIDLRRHRRVALQLPVLVRNFSGNVDVTKSENVSKGGICFASEKNFLIGEGVLVACPYSGENNQNLEVNAKTVRRQNIGGSKRQIYGVRYDQ